MKNKYFSITTYMSFLIILSIGYIKDTIRKVLCLFYTQKHDGMIPIVTEFQSFYSRNCFARSSDCFSFPTRGRPGRIVSIVERMHNFETNELVLTEKTAQLINFGSYNYLGFASVKGKILKELHKAMQTYPINLSAPALDIGKPRVVIDLEKQMANFLYQEDCVIFSMGYGTNSSCLPLLLDEGTLVYSDELNHASLITGIKMSSCVVKVFAHNNMEELEKRLRFDISQGQPVTHRSWKKIVVIVEGIYSMEGSILRLKELVKLKKKYKFYIFIDEAHSIGALGKTGRGICEYHGVDFRDVDILMGTFTKSFAGMGGYIAGSTELINYLRTYSDFSMYGEQMSPIVAVQILQSLNCIMYTKEGKERIKRLQRNTRLLREGLSKMGLFVVGDSDSPVVPIILSNPGKLCEFSRLCREEGIGIVIVGYPAAPILFGRVRLCVSAALLKKDIFRTLVIFDKASELLGLKLLR